MSGNTIYTGHYLLSGKSHFPLLFNNNNNIISLLPPDLSFYCRRQQLPSQFIGYPPTDDFPAQMMVNLIMVISYESTPISSNHHPLPPPPITNNKLLLTRQQNHNHPHVLVNITLTLFASGNTRNEIINLYPIYMCTRTVCRWVKQNSNAVKETSNDLSRN